MRIQIGQLLKQGLIKKEVVKYFNFIYYFQSNSFIFFNKSQGFNKAQLNIFNKGFLN